MNLTDIHHYNLIDKYNNYGVAAAVLIGISLGAGSLYAALAAIPFMYFQFKNR